MPQTIAIDPELQADIEALPGDDALQRRIEDGFQAADLKAGDRIEPRLLRLLFRHARDAILELLPLRRYPEGLFLPDEWDEIIEEATPARISLMQSRGALLSNSTLSLCKAACRSKEWDDLAVEVFSGEAGMTETILGHDLFTPICLERPDLVERMLLKLAACRSEREIYNSFRALADAGLTGAYTCLWLALPRERCVPEMFEFVSRPVFCEAATPTDLITALSNATSNHARMQMQARLPRLRDLLAHPEMIHDIHRQFQK